MSVGEFTSFIAALMLITAPLRRLVNVAGPLQQGIAAAQSIFEILDATPEPEGGGRPIERARGDIEYRDVRFRYPSGEDEVLRGVSFALRSGETVAIVGRSGSGKSTLVGLLPRFYDVTAGRVLLDGHDVREYGLADLRRQMSLVSQDVVLFNDTIAQQHRLRLPGQRRHRSPLRPRRRKSTNSHDSCPTGSIPSSAIAARCCRAVSGSGSRSRERCCATRRS